MSEQSHMAALLKAVTQQSSEEQKKSDIKFKQNIVIKRKNSKQTEIENQLATKKVQITQQNAKIAQSEAQQPTQNPKKLKKQKQKQQTQQLNNQNLSNWEQFKNKETKTPNQNQNQNQQQQNHQKNNNNLHLSLIPDPKAFKGVTPIVALDCEMVMCEDFEQGQKHFLARISIVNYNGHVLMDQYVNPKRKVVNYLTWVSGIKPHHIIGAPTLSDILPKMKSILDNKVIVGHSIKNDFDVMFYFPTSKFIRDISKFPFLKNKQTGKTLSLKNMNSQFLNLSIQNGQHSSVEDARASMLIYRKFEKQIEESIKNQGYNGLKNRLLSDIKK